MSSRLLRSMSDFERILYELTHGGLDVNGTYEFLNEQISMRKTNTQMVKEMFDISDEFEKRFIKSISTFSREQIGPYDTEKYFLILPTMSKAIDEIMLDCLETRRAIIQFQPEHCFQSIQFLIRENTINVSCYMRSCNLLKNFPYDLWLCFKLADIFRLKIQEAYGYETYPFYNVTMTFGSLHVFKEEFR